MSESLNIITVVIAHMKVQSKRRKDIFDLGRAYLLFLNILRQKKFFCSSLSLF